jgi:TFIIF-interacting CTD phosphatase-like protein
MTVMTFAAEGADEIVEVSRTGGCKGELALGFRPYLFEFLEDMQSKYELVLYSSFSSEYLQAIADSVERRKKYFTHRFHDDFCLFANISYSVKCLDFLCGNRSPANIILLDNTPRTLPLTPDNFLSVPFYSGSQDAELPKVAAVLEGLAAVPDLRTALRQFREQY